MRFIVGYLTAIIWIYISLNSLVLTYNLKKEDSAVIGSKKSTEMVDISIKNTSE